MCHGMNMTGPMCSFLADFEQDDSLCCFDGRPLAGTLRLFWRG